MNDKDVLSRILDDEVVGQWIEDCMAGLDGDYLLIYDSHKTLRERFEAAQEVIRESVAMLTEKHIELERTQTEVVELKRVNEAYDAQLLAATNDVGELEERERRLREALEYVAPFMYEQYNDSYGQRTFECADCCRTGIGNIPIDANIPHEPGCRIAEIQALALPTPTEGSKENDG